MNPAVEFMRMLGAILIEQGWYRLAIELVMIAVIITQYRKMRSKKPSTSWRIRERLFGILGKSPAKATPRSQEDDSTHTAASAMEPSSPNEQLQGEHIPEVRLKKTVARIQSRSSFEPSTAFSTDRLRSEVLSPMYAYLGDLERSLSSPSIECSVSFKCSARLSNGQMWRYSGNETRRLDQLPKEAMEIDFSVDISFRLSKEMAKDFSAIDVVGRFIGENKGRWRVRNIDYINVGQDLEMYNWYGLRQRISDVIDTVLTGFFGR